MAEVAAAAATPSPVESVSPKAGPAYVTSLAEDKGRLQFTLAHIDASLANGIRRTILCDIPTLCFKVFPHKECDITIHKNTSRFNNEILKQRLGCIPIHISDLALPYHELVVEVNMENTGKEIIYLTTGDFKIKNTKTEKYVADTTVVKIFPPDPQTGDHILLARLRPKISNEVPGEIIHLEAKMSLHTAQEDGMYNVVSCCSYGYTPDRLEQDSQWQKFLAGLDPEQKEPETLSLTQQDWYNHQAKRIFKKNYFDFTVETVGVFTNTYIVRTACTIIVARLRAVQEQNGVTIKESQATMPLCYDILLENEGYTIGKLIEASLYKLFYTKERLLAYVSFRKSHPHDKHSVIRIALKDIERFESEEKEPFIISMLETACKELIGIIDEIVVSFE